MNEGAGFVQFTPNGPGAATLQNLTLSIIACGVSAESLRRYHTGYTSYRYQYAGNFSNVSPVWWFGAYHSSELPLLFGTHDEYRARSTPEEWATSYAMQAFWLSFASDPSAGPRWLAPNGSYVAWPKFQPGNASMALFAEGETLVRWVAPERIDNECPR